MVPNILKEVDINFGYYKHNKGLKNGGKTCFFPIEIDRGRITMENSITFNVFLIETFPKDDLEKSRFDWVVLSQFKLTPVYNGGKRMGCGYLYLFQGKIMNF